MGIVQPPRVARTRFPVKYQGVCCPKVPSPARITETLFVNSTSPVSFRAGWAGRVESGCDSELVSQLTTPCLASSKPLGTIEKMRRRRRVFTGFFRPELPHKGGIFTGRQSIQTSLYFAHYQHKIWCSGDYGRV